MEKRYGSIVVEESFWEGAVMGVSGPAWVRLQQELPLRWQPFKAVRNLALWMAGALAQSISIVATTVGVLNIDDNVAL